jgi:hypothetical protein
MDDTQQPPRVQVGFVTQLFDAGMVDEHEAEGLIEPIEHRIWRLELKGPRWTHPSLGQVRFSVSAQDLVKMMAEPGPHGSLPHLNPREAIYMRKELENSVKMSIFTLYGSKLAKFQPAAPARIGQSQPGVAGLRVAGWLTETLVRSWQWVVSVGGVLHVHISLSPTTAPTSETRQSRRS